MSMKCGKIEQCSRSKSKGKHKTGAKQTRTSTKLEARSGSMEDLATVDWSYP